MALQTLIEKIIFRPVSLPDEYEFKFEVPFEELNFSPEPGASINALYFECQQALGTMYYFHGNKDNLARWGKIASELLQFNYNVVVMDYRGYGKSKGTRTETNLFEDALFCYQAMEQRLNSKNVVVYGRSLGTGIAAWLASKIQPQGLVLETPYFDMHDLIGHYLPPLFYRNQLNFKLSSHLYLNKSSFPIHIFHGTNDEVVPFKSGKKLFDSIHNPNKQLTVIPGGKHNNLSNFDAYWQHLEQFLKR